jgi:hypothetical protein
MVSRALLTFQTSSRVSQSRWDFFLSPSLKFCNRQHVFIELRRSLAIRKTHQQSLLATDKQSRQGERRYERERKFCALMVQAVKETQGRHSKTEQAPHLTGCWPPSLSRPLLKSFYNMNKQLLISKESASSRTVSETLQHALASQSRNKRLGNRDLWYSHSSYRQTKPLPAATNLLLVPVLWS